MQEIDCILRVKQGDKASHPNNTKAADNGTETTRNAKEDEEEEP